MTTEQLIDTLLRDLHPSIGVDLRRRNVRVILVGAATSLGTLYVMCGTPPDLQSVLVSHGLWMKWCFAGALSLVAILAMVQLARPGVAVMKRAWFSVPLMGMAALAAFELIALPTADWRQAWLGQSALVCPLRITLLSLPLLISFDLVLRQMAPTRLRKTGATAGIAAGACAAACYALVCDEVSALFVLNWYSLGIASAGVIGALARPRLLRW